MEGGVSESVEGEIGEGVHVEGEIGEGVKVRGGSVRGCGGRE